MARVRQPQAAIWGFYPLDRSALLRELERCFTDGRLGPGSIPRRSVSSKMKSIVGGIAPHAGYVFSGPCAAWLYKEIGEAVERVDTVIIMGSNHTGYGGAITTTTHYSEWATPLGSIEVDTEFISELKELYPALSDDMLAHAREHSVEVQLPFLQYVLGSEFKLVPIVVKDISYVEAHDFAHSLFKTIRALERRVLVIVSSDFTHHGPAYGYVLFRENIAARVRELDLEFIKRIVELNTQEFLKLIRKYDATVCGYGAIAIAMEYTKLANASARLLKYYNSADVTGEEDMVVGYASIELSKEFT